MTQKQEKSAAQAIRSKFAGQVYMDPTYDTAFKAFFDSEDALKDFLDGALGLKGKDKIAEITYTFEKTYNYPLPSGKMVVLDIFAKTGSERFLNIEMQRAEHEFFIDRVILYKAYLTIAGMIDKQKSKEFMDLPKEERELRRYELPETVSIWICNFELPEMHGRYLDTWGLYSHDSIAGGVPIPICPKNKYLIISLPEFTKVQQDLHDTFDQWLYLLTHASDGTELPNFGNKAMEDALRRIRVADADDKLLASQAKDMSAEETYAVRMAGAMIKARKENSMEIAGRMLQSHEPVEKISAYTGLSVEEIKKLEAEFAKLH